MVDTRYDSRKTKKAVFQGEQRNLYAKECLQCHTEFWISNHKYADRKYCSIACRGLARRNRITLTCQFCKKEFQSYPSKAATKYCSKACADDAKKVSLNLELTSKDYKLLAKARLPQICNRCGYVEYTQVLQVHHVDHNHDNNILENLEMLCPTCHAVEHYLEKSN